MDAPQKSSMNARATPGPVFQKNTDCKELHLEHQEKSVASQTLMPAETELEAGQPQFKRSDQIDFDDKNAAVATEFCAHKKKAGCEYSPTEEEPRQTENHHLVLARRPSTPDHQVTDSQLGTIGNDTACSRPSQTAIVEIIAEISEILPAMNDKQVQFLEKTLVACGIKSREDMAHLEPTQLVNVFGTEKAKKVVVHFNPDARQPNWVHLLSGFSRYCADEEERTEVMCSAAAQEMSNIMTEHCKKAQESSENIKRELDSFNAEMNTTWESIARNMDENMLRSKNEHEMFLQSFQRLSRKPDEDTVLRSGSDDDEHDLHSNNEENGHPDTKSKQKKSLFQKLFD